MSDKENSASKKSRFRMARGWVAFACVAFALAGMAFRVGIGTPSAFSKSRPFARWAPSRPWRAQKASCCIRYCCLRWSWC